MSEKFLFHYTSLLGLCGIFCTKAIWASSIRRQKDPNEFNHAINVASEVIANSLASSELSSEKILLERIQKMLSESRDDIMIHYDIFVASFSDEGDLANQWRDYCPPGEGVSIGFDRLQLFEVAISRLFGPYPCEYDRYRQQTCIGQLLSILLADWHSDYQGATDNDTITYIAREFIGNLYYIAPRLKEKYQEEREWRLISDKKVRPIQLGEVKIRGALSVREEESLIIPYYELSLARVGERVRVPQLFVSPSKNQEHLHDTVAHIVKAFQDRIEVGEVILSKIPYDSVGWDNTR